MCRMATKKIAICKSKYLKEQNGVPNTLPRKRTKTDADTDRNPYLLRKDTVSLVRLDSVEVHPRKTKTTSPALIARNPKAETNGKVHHRRLHPQQEMTLLIDAFCSCESA